jgi:hypothetical protein
MSMSSTYKLINTPDSGFLNTLGSLYRGWKPSFLSPLQASIYHSLPDYRAKGL